MILAIVLALGILGGALAGGRLRGLSGATLRGAWILILLFMLQVALPLLSPASGVQQVLRWVWLLTFPAMLAVAVMNVREPGMALVAVGLALNSLVIAANGAMPVSAQAALAAGSSLAGAAPSVSDFAHIPVTAATRLALLADVIPTAGPRGLAVVMSAGDVALYAGLASFIAKNMNMVPVVHHK